VSQLAQAEGVLKDLPLGKGLSLAWDTLDVQSNSQTLAAAADLKDETKDF
jgi:hypothetical protein